MTDPKALARYTGIVVAPARDRALIHTIRRAAPVVGAAGAAAVGVRAGFRLMRALRRKMSAPVTPPVEMIPAPEPSKTPAGERRVTLRYISIRSITIITRDSE
jgi:hypothetical protein